MKLSKAFLLQRYGTGRKAWEEMNIFPDKTVTMLEFEDLLIRSLSTHQDYFYLFCGF